MTESLVSVVVPTYNRKHLLAEAVESCLAQTHRNVEVIIVDDGSTDGTEAHVGKKTAGDWRSRIVRYYQKTNNGPAAARQYGLERAQGEFVQFLDSDDLILPTKLERQILALQEAGSDAAGCSCYGRKGAKADGWQKATRIGYKGNSVAEYVRAMCLPINYPMQCSAPLWRRSFLVCQTGWPDDLCCSEDWAYYVSLLVKAKNVAFVDEDLFWLRDHEMDRASVTNRRASGNLRKLVSSAQAIQMVEASVRDAGLFNRETQAGLLHIGRSVYTLLLELGATNELKAFEQYTRRLASNPNTISAVSLAGWFRQFFGTRATRWSVRRYIGRGCVSSSSGNRTVAN
jgi:glycosyltransferase involved in cell wall biosynthesis